MGSSQLSTQTKCTYQNLIRNFAGFSKTLITFFFLWKLGLGGLGRCDFPVYFFIILFYFPIYMWFDFPNIYLYILYIIYILLSYSVFVLPNYLEIYIFSEKYVTSFRRIYLSLRDDENQYLFCIIDWGERVIYIVYLFDFHPGKFSSITKPTKQTNQLFLSPKKV